MRETTVTEETIARIAVAVGVSLPDHYRRRSGGDRPESDASDGPKAGRGAARERIAGPG